MKSLIRYLNFQFQVDNSKTDVRPRFTAGKLLRKSTGTALLLYGFHNKPNRLELQENEATSAENVSTLKFRCHFSFFTNREFFYIT